MKKLSAKSLLKFRMVSKSWKYTIDSDIFGREYGAILWNPCLRKCNGIEVPFMPNRPALEKIRRAIACVNVYFELGVHPDTLDPTILNISYELYMLLSFDLINHQFHVLDRPTQVRNSLPIPFYISNLGNSLVISGNLIHDENRYICAWLLEVGAAVVTSWRVLFVIPSQNIAKLLGFTMEDDPIVEVFSGQEMIHTLQVYDRPSQQFHNVGIEGDGGSFFIGPYKESLILLNPRQNYYGCEFFLWKEERVRLLINSPGASSTPSISPGTSSTPILSPTTSTPPNYYVGSSSNTDCSNCKHLLGRIKVLQATLEMHMHPEHHTLDSTALLHDLNNDMEKLGWK
ncbi:transposase, MuDR, MULE transposase domain protein [Tanacetum coccineum]